VIETLAPDFGGPPILANVQSMLWHFDTGVGLAGPRGQGLRNPAAICRGLGRFSADTDSDCHSGAISLMSGIVGDLGPIL
jgi:hypothetical protein